MRFRWIAVATLATCLFVASSEAAVKPVSVPMLDRLLAAQGTAKVALPTGAVALKVALAPLPATIDTGTAQFDATIYKAYLASSTDLSVEVPLGSVFPTAAGTAQIKVALKGDLSKLGLDRVLIVAYSKDGLSSFDVLTGTLSAR